MKRYVTLIPLVFFFTLTSFAQSNEMKGPASKNYKPWKNPKSPETIYLVVREDVTGPAAKNRKPWKGSTEAPYMAAAEGVNGPAVKATQLSGRKRVAINTKNSEKLTGPKAKNRKPWKQ